MTIADMFMGATSAYAGSETAPYVLTMIIYSLCRYPEVMERLQKEIDKAAVRPASENRLISFDEVKDLPYLNAVIQETLRLYPVPGMVLPRRVPKGGAMICGYYFREGIDVGLNYWATRTNEKYFGKDAVSFKPERWLGPPEKVKELQYYNMPVCGKLFSRGTTAPPYRFFSDSFAVLDRSPNLPGEEYCHG